MVKQKLVINLPVNGKKSLSKVLQIAGGVAGVETVESLAVTGQDKNQIEVTGDGIDAFLLTKLLRKNMGFAVLVSVNMYEVDSSHAPPCSMASWILSVLLQSLNSLIQTEFGLLSGVHKEMKKLSSTLSAIQAVLEDAEEKQLRDREIRNWLVRLKDAAYELDDILDDCSTEALRREYKGQSSGLTCYPIPNIPFIDRKIGTRMKEITEYLGTIADEQTKFHLGEAVAEKKRVELAKRRENSSLLTQSELYGRDEDKEKIVKVLVEDVCDSEGLSVYPIVGMGGLGKTTLAQMAFNDERVKSHFEPRIWVCVSQDFDAKRLIRATIESTSVKACEILDLDSLKWGLQELLNGKRYLIALDDVWNEDQEEWDKLMYALECGAKGASLIVTTRIEKVAAIMSTVPPHHLSSLSEDDCWLLFRQRAYGHENEENPKLVAIGKEIVKKCGGVPLAAKALGGLLRFKSDEKDWVFVKESEMWNLPQDENSILPALRLSYYSLPLELRRCFAYCAIFPKGSRIEKEDLICLWMANGYVSWDGKRELEDIGEDICNELFWRSFFQVVDKVEFYKMPTFGTLDFKMQNIGCTTWFKMHDLVHDLAHSVMEDERQMMGAESSSNVRCVSLESLLREENQAARIPFRRDKYDFRKFGSLRVVYGRGDGMSNLPPSIGNLKHLRYLDISHSYIEQLPDSICSMWNLQTLILDYCHKLKKLSKNMNYLSGLRHLYLTGCPLIEMPPKIGQLTCLKTLTLFVVGESIGCSPLVELQCLNLGGRLRIEHLERVRNPTDAKEANLVGKKNLHLLELSWEHNAAFESQENVEELLEALKPHPNLKGLSIENYKGTHLPCWMSYDRVIYFHTCYEKVESLAEGLEYLTSLQWLLIKNCEKLTSLPEGLGHLTSLLWLSIVDCPNMVSLPASIQSLTKLHRLEIMFCGPELKRRCQKEIGDDWYKIAHVPQVFISENWRW